jgi:hypothetical protein
LIVAPLLVVGFATFFFLLNPLNVNQLPTRYIVITSFPILALSFLLISVKYFSNPFLKWNMKKQYESSPLLKEPQTISFDDEGINGETYLSSGLTKWAAIIEATETKDDFFFFISNKYAMFTPKRAFSDEDQIEQVRELAKEKLGDKAKMIA